MPSRCFFILHQSHMDGVAQPSQDEQRAGNVGRNDADCGPARLALQRSHPAICDIPRADAHGTHRAMVSWCAQLAHVGLGVCAGPWIIQSALWLSWCVLHAQMCYMIQDEEEEEIYNVVHDLCMSYARLMP